MALSGAKGLKGLFPISESEMGTAQKKLKIKAVAPEPSHLGQDTDRPLRLSFFQIGPSTSFAVLSPMRSSHRVALA